MISIKFHKKKKDLLIVILSYSEELLKKIRQIKGRKWDPERKYCTIPNDEVTINRFKKLFINEEADYSRITQNDSSINKLNERDKKLISELKKRIKLKGYSRETCKSYVSNIIHFMSFLSRYFQILFP